jgi:NAD(P)-dependent dehydrogenase (short-subunit alcohol dehydrogenase family)
MDLGLRGRNAIVTGGSLGIGKAIARELAREGADVAIVARTKDRLEAAAGELAAETGRRVIALAADVTSRTQVDAMVAEAAARLGGVHILVNSGSPPGGSPTATGPIETVVDEDLLHDFDVKYVGALRCARAAIPHMKAQRWGRIVNVSGTNARNAGNLSGGARRHAGKSATDRRTCGKASAAVDLSGQGLCQRRRADDVRLKRLSHVSSRGDSCRQDLQRCEACRPPCRTADEVGVRDQPQDCEGAWPDDPAVAIAAGGPCN